MELFECARRYLGSWAAIVSAPQRPLPALLACRGAASRSAVLVSATASSRLGDAGPSICLPELAKRH